MKYLWGRCNWLDLAGALLAVAALALPAQALSSGQAFAGAAAGVVALMATVTTFGCAMVYQSSSQTVVAVRARFGPELRRVWAWVVSTVLGCALVCLCSIPFMPGRPRAGWAICLGAIGVASLATWRAVHYIRMVLALEEEQSRVDAAKP